jgi:hypothetical protein
VGVKKGKPPPAIAPDSDGGKGHKELSKKRSFGVWFVNKGRKDAKNPKKSFSIIKSES